MRSFAGTKPLLGPDRPGRYDLDLESAALLEMEIEWTRHGEF